MSAHLHHLKNNTLIYNSPSPYIFLYHFSRIMNVIILYPPSYTYIVISLFVMQHLTLKKVKAANHELTLLMARMTEMERGSSVKTDKKLQFLKKLARKAEDKQKEQKVFRSMCGALLPCNDNFLDMGNIQSQTGHTQFPARLIN